MGEIVTIDKKEDKQAAFIRLFVETGDCQKAALEAGYAHGEYGYELKDRLAYEIRDAVTKRIAGVTPMALSTLTKLARDAESESVKRQAAKDIMSLGGFDIQRTEDLTEKRDTRTDEELIAALAEMATQTPELRKALQEKMEEG